MTEASTILLGQFEGNPALKPLRNQHYGDLHAPWCEIITKVAIAVIAALVATVGAYLIHLGGAGIATLFWAGVGVSSLGGAAFLITMTFLIKQSVSSYRDHKNQEKIVDGKSVTNEQLRETLTADGVKDTSRIDAVKKLSQEKFLENLKELDGKCLASGHAITPGEEALFSAYAKADQLKELTQAQVDELSQECCLQLLKDIPADQGYDAAAAVGTSIVEMLVARLTPQQKVDNLNLFEKHTQTIARGDTFKNLVQLFLDKCKNRGANDLLPGADHFVFLKHFPDKVGEWFKAQEAAGWFTTNVDISQSVAVGTLNNMGDVLPALMKALKANEAVYTHVITAFATQWKQAFNDADPKALPAAVNNHEIFARLVTEEALFHAIFSENEFKDETAFMYALLTHANANPSAALTQFNGAGLEVLYTSFEIKVPVDAVALSDAQKPLAKALAEKIHGRRDDVDWNQVPLVIRLTYLQQMTLPDGEKQAAAIMGSLSKEQLQANLTTVALIPNAFRQLDETMRQEIVNGWLGKFSTKVSIGDRVFALVAKDIQLALDIVMDAKNHNLKIRSHLADGLLRVMKDNQDELSQFIASLNKEAQDVINHIYSGWKTTYSNGDVNAALTEHPLFQYVVATPDDFKAMIAHVKQQDPWKTFVLGALEAADDKRADLIDALEDEDFTALVLQLRQQVAEKALDKLTDFQRQLCQAFNADDRFNADQGVKATNNEANWTVFDAAVKSLEKTE